MHVQTLNFIPIFGRKQKLQLSKVKSAILQLNPRYYRNCYRTPKTRIKLSLTVIAWQIYKFTDIQSEKNMIITYARNVPTFYSKADQHFGSEVQAIWADLPQGPINAAILPFRKRPKVCIKVAGEHFEHAV